MLANLLQQKNNKGAVENPAAGMEFDQLGTTPANELDDMMMFGVSPHLARMSITDKADNKMRVQDFTLMKVIGKGSFGKVMLVRRKFGNDKDRVYAMKVLHKDNVVKRNQVEHTKTERSVLGAVDHPFIVKLIYAFQTKKKLYFVMDYCSGGELFYHLGRAGRFSENRTRFYAAEIVLALEHLHTLGIVYRDLKPENVMLDAKGHIVITDFGLSKEGIEDNTSAHSFCGTPEYLAPEILTRSGHGRAADWWSLGALMYEMLTGMPPFYSRNRERLFVKILKSTLRLPVFFSPEAGSLIASLLDRNATTRLGSTTDSAEIKLHPFFNGVDWTALYNKQVSPPFQPPEPKDVLDTRNFEAEFTNMPLDSVETPPNNSLAASMGPSRFSGFTYYGNPDLGTCEEKKGR